MEIKINILVKNLLKKELQKLEEYLEMKLQEEKYLNQKWEYQIRIYKTRK